MILIKILPPRYLPLTEIMLDPMTLLFYVTSMMCIFYFFQFFYVDISHLVYSTS